MSNGTAPKKQKGNGNPGNKQVQPQQPLAYERFELSTPDFGFTKGETAFVRKMIQRKYPAVIHTFVDHARELMEVLQMAAQPKLQYEASLRFNRAGTRAHPSEVLYSPHKEEVPEGTCLSTVVSIENISQERRDLIRQNKAELIAQNSLDGVLTFLENVTNDTSSFSSALIKTTNSSFLKFASCLHSFLVKFRKEAVIYSFDIEAGEHPHFFVEIGHLGNQNHLLLILFELKWNDPVVIPADDAVIEASDDGLLIITG